jgi:hypothetical protein
MMGSVCAQKLSGGAEVWERLLEHTLVVVVVLLLIMMMTIYMERHSK